MLFALDDLAYPQHPKSCLTPIHKRKLSRIVLVPGRHERKKVSCLTSAGNLR